LLDEYCINFGDDANIPTKIPIPFLSYEMMGDVRYGKDMIIFKKSVALDETVSRQRMEMRLIGGHENLLWGSAAFWGSFVHDFVHDLA